MRLTVLIPAFNEEKTIKKVIEEIPKKIVFTSNIFHLGTTFAICCFKEKPVGFFDGT